MPRLHQRETRIASAQLRYRQALATPDCYRIGRLSAVLGFTPRGKSFQPSIPGEMSGLPAPVALAIPVMEGVVCVRERRRNGNPYSNAENSSRLPAPKPRRTRHCSWDSAMVQSIGQPLKRFRRLCETSTKHAIGTDSVARSLLVNYPHGRLLVCAWSLPNHLHLPTLLGGQPWYDWRLLQWFRCWGSPCCL